MAANVETVRPYRRDWRLGRVTSWLTTTDHKRIGILYIWTALVFFVIGGFLALLIRTQLATPEENFVTKDTYNQLFTIHGTTMIFLVVVPMNKILERRRAGQEPEAEEVSAEVAALREIRDLVASRNGQL